MHGVVAVCNLQYRATLMREGHLDGCVAVSSDATAAIDRVRTL